MRVFTARVARVLAVVVLSSAAGGVARGQAADANPVQNSGFEQGLTSWSVQSWPQRDPAQKAEASLDTRTRHSGRASFRLTVDYAENAQIFSPSQTVPVSVDREYVLSAFIKTELASGSIQLNLQDARDWKLLSAASALVSGRQDWTLVEVSFRTKRDTEAIRLGLGHVGRAGDKQPMQGTIWLDDVALREKQAGRPGLSARELDAEIRHSRLITLENDAVKIAFTEPRLRVRSIEFKRKPGLQLSPGPLPEVPLYQIKLRGPEGRTEEIRSTDAVSVVVSGQDGQPPRRCVLEARHGGALDKVLIHVALDDSGFVDLRLEPGRLKAGWALSELVFPQIATRGLLSDAPRDTFVGGGEPVSLGGGWNLPGGKYPVSAQIPLLYQSGPRGGIYLMVLDPDQWVKTVRMVPQLDAAEQTLTAITWQYAVEIAAGDPLPRYTARLGPIQDSPYEAADVYRDWAAGQAWCPPPLAERKDIPAWRLRGVPHYFYYQSQSRPGTGGKRADKAPARTIEELRKAHPNRMTLQDVPVIMESLPPEIRALGGAVDLRGWEKWGLWMNPDWWPPRDGEPALRRAIAAIHKAGLHVTTDIQFNHLSIHRPRESGGFGEEGLRAIEARGLVVQDVGMMNEKGEIPWYGPLGAQNNYACENVPAAFNDVAWTLKRMLDVGFDEAQFDGGGWRIDSPCWNSKHAHPPGPGYWQTAGARDYYDRMRAAVSGARPSAVGFFEEYYNELRLHSYSAVYTRQAQSLMQTGYTGQQERRRYVEGRITPQPSMYSYVYHDRMIETGFFWTHGPADYQVAVNMALGVCAGPQGTPWLDFPNILGDRWMRIFLAGTKARETFARPYLLLGRMLSPIRVEPTVAMSITRREPDVNEPVRETYQVPAVVQQAYRAANGKIGWVLVNHTSQSVTCEPQPSRTAWFRELAAARAIRRISVDGAQPFAPRDLTRFTLAPGEVVLLEQE